MLGVIDYQVGDLRMDESMLASLTSPPTSADRQAAALNYYENLKKSDVGWQLCLQAVSSKQYASPSIQFVCLQVIEHFVKTRYTTCTLMDQQILRDFLCAWARIEANSISEPAITGDNTFLKNKVAQITALVFVQDYPVRWPTFFNDLLLSCLTMGETAVDHYLRVLLAIDLEISDRDVHRSNMELQRNNVIKQAMRDNVVNSLVDSWFNILTTYEKSNPGVVCRCLQVIGAYIHWIDINLVANEKLVPVLVKELSCASIREAAAECIFGILMKGMEPVAKIQLIESFNSVLNSVGAWNCVRTETDESDAEYVGKMGKILNGMGTCLIDCYTKISKTETKDSERCRAILQSIEAKVDLTLEYLGYAYDDVSISVFDFVRDYLHLIKGKPMLSDIERKILVNALNMVIKKMRCEDDYDFECEGEDEAEYDEFRKQMKVLFDNIALIDKDLVLKHVQTVVTNTLQTWRDVPAEDSELALYLMYVCGDTTPAASITAFTHDVDTSSPMQLMMLLMVKSDIYSHSNCGVVVQFFENALKYDKFFIVHPDYILPVLSAFLKENNGLFHRSRKVRSRCAYLLSKFIKTVKVHLLPNVTNTILQTIQPLLSLEAAFTLPESDRLISEDDQLYLYEVVGTIILGGESTLEEKAKYMGQVISPLLDTAKMVTNLYLTENDAAKRTQLLNVIVQAISVTGRLSKAFSSQQSMKSVGCTSIFIDAMMVFVTTLKTIPWSEQIVTLQGAVRQYLHRMVMCIEEEVLGYILPASEALLKGGDLKSIQEYIPLINQIINKYKLSWVFQKEVTPFLQQMFTPMIRTIFAALSAPIEENDQQAMRDKQIMQRQYFNFIHAIVTNNLTDVLSSQEPIVLQEVLRTVIQGSVDFPDPVAQKTCFAILKKLIELWGGQGGPEGFVEFMYKEIVPACFMSPMRDSFDLQDAQTLLVLNETAAVLLTIVDSRKEEFVAYLQNQYLPTLKLPVLTIQAYTNALQSNPKNFKSYLKAFFTQAKESSIPS